jgi:autotransporter-associated beta strand protein
VTADVTMSINRGITLGGNSTIDVASGKSLVYGGVIAGSNYALTKSGSGTLELSGTNTFSAGTALNTKADAFGAPIPNTDRLVTYSSAFTSGVDSFAVIYDLNNQIGYYADNFTTRIVSTTNTGFIYFI